MTKGSIIVISAAVAGTFGCINREVAEVEPKQSVEQVLDVPLNLNSDLDLLFVVDNSGSMLDEQTSLATNFGRFINVLSTIEGLGLPNVHIGVVSTDMGTGQFRAGGCDGSGDAGILQNTPRVPGCSAPAGKFISDVSDGAGGRVTNYTGTLADTFSCIAQLGIDGCGFEQPLESMRKALDGTVADNQGFLRDEALLGIVIITDEDDCSASDTQVFDPSQNSIDDPLGPLSGHRCFEFGVVCDPDQPRQTGIKTDCKPREDSPYIYGVQDYVDFVKGLKSNVKDIFVAGIMGPPTPVVVGVDDNGNPAVEKSCVTNDGEAEPPIRIQSFVDAFGTNSTVATICEADLQAALILIAEKMKRLFGDPCLEGDMVMPPECSVSEVLDGYETLIPKCNDDVGSGATNQPCYLFVDDTADCPARGCCTQDTGLAVKLYPEERSVPTGTRLVVRCLLN